MRIEHHLLALAGIGDQPERAACAQRRVCQRQASVDAADHQALFAPIELERFTLLEGQRHNGDPRPRLSLSLAPRANEIGDARIAAAIAGGSTLCEQRQRRTALAFRSVGVDLQRPLQRLMKHRQLVRPQASPVLRRTHQRTLPSNPLSIVLRDKPVKRAISRTDFMPRRCSRRTLPIMLMVITP